MNICDFLSNTGAADDVAIVDGQRHHTYAELRAAAATVAGSVSALQLAPGSRIAILGPNSFFWVASYLAIMKLGMVAVPLSDKGTSADVRRSISAVDCSAALVDRRHLRHDPAAADFVTVITDDVLDSGQDPYWPETTTEAGSDAVLLFTSGTTGAPKAVRVTHRNIAANTESIISYLGLERTDRALVILPFFYCYGASLLHTHLRVGATLVLCNSFAFPETTAKLLEEQECTVFAGVPSSFQLMLRATSFAQRATPSLRIIQQAGGKLPPVMIEELLAAKPHAALFVMYGQTEATARLSYLPPAMLTEKLGSIGKGIPGVELRVLGHDLEPVPAGGKGEIYARGPSISPGYYGEPEGTSDKFTPHGLRTGDVAVVDEDGYVFIVDRRDDFIKSWGYRVSSQEVEAAALRMPQLVSAAAIGVPDDVAGEAIVLFVTVAPDSAITTDAVAAACRRSLPKHMVPKQVVVLDGMPLNASGKIAKTRLRDLAAARASSALAHPG
ncbi:class I adenylate-forming enzyme family protein [Mycolicibacterium lacusdiani]|uniref:class I adenylate-forming enzyme family protein n=1 Tax=Mycolicibacterium lacusdiani TaxID=2895283 RepID=UPI001F18F7DF|nr:AMP-binding protein [Mycolicibacterium lacusdiani]